MQDNSTEQKPYGTIYRAQHKATGRTYIGKTKRSLKKRIREHFIDADIVSYFGRALRTYGVDAFAISVVDFASSEEELWRKEIEWIARENCTHPKGYNLTHGGEGAGLLTEEAKKRHSEYARNRTPEHRKKLAESRRGKTVSQETKDRISKACTGIKLTPEQIAKRIGIPRSPETRARISRYQRGRAKSKEARKNMSAAQRALGKKISEEQKKRLSEINTGKTYTEASKAKNPSRLKWHGHRDVPRPANRKANCSLYKHPTCTRIQRHGSA